MCKPLHASGRTAAHGTHAAMSPTLPRDLGQRTGTAHRSPPRLRRLNVASRKPTHLTAMISGDRAISEQFRVPRSTRLPEPGKVVEPPAATPALAAAHVPVSQRTTQRPTAVVGATVSIQSLLEKRITVWKVPWPDGW